MHPLRFEPIIKQLIWGGKRLGSLLHKPIGNAPFSGESWEVSDHRSDVSVVAEGALSGTTLRDLIHHRKEDLLGKAFTHLEQFPLLVKYIDARETLSVQVHPNDEQGHRLANDNGKTETWIVVDAEPGSVIYVGLNEGITREMFIDAIATGEVEPLLHKIPAVVGDCILVPAGIVHAIGAGVMVAEIQQMSNATFRVFDWNRLDADGKPRDLHISQALESINFEAGPVNPIRGVSEPVPGGTKQRLSHTEYFSLHRFDLDGTIKIGRDDRFTIVMALDGEIDVRSADYSLILRQGETLLLPACLNVCDVSPVARHAKVVTCVVPSFV